MKFKKRDVADIIRDSIPLEDGNDYIAECHSFTLLNNFNFLEGLFQSSMSLIDTIIFTNGSNRSVNHVSYLYVEAFFPTQG